MAAVSMPNGQRVVIRDRVHLPFFNALAIDWPQLLEDVGDDGIRGVHLANPPLGTLTVEQLAAFTGRSAWAVKRQLVAILSREMRGRRTATQWRQVTRRA
jgi:hypothetical protein